MRSRFCSFLLLCFFILTLSGCDLSWEEIKAKVGLNDKKESFILGDGYVLDFGSVTVGTENIQTLRIHGIALSGVQIVKFDLDDKANVFAVVNNTCTTPSNDEDTQDACDIKMLFKPKDIKDYQATVTVYGRITTGEQKNTKSLTKLTRISLKGTGAQAALYATPNVYDWGILNVSEQGAFIAQPAPIQISTHLAQPLQIQQVKVQGNFSIVEDACTSKSVSAQESCTVTVQPSIQKEGNYTGTLTILTSNPYVAPAVVILQAQAQYPSSVTVTPDKLVLKDKASANTKKASIKGTVQVQNTGFASLAVTQAVVQPETSEGGSQQWNVINDCTGLQLSKRETCQVSAIGTLDPGTYTARLVLSFDKLRHIIIPIEATIEKNTDETNDSDNNTELVDLSITPTSYNYGSVEVGKEESAEFTVSNNGSKSANISISVSGSSFHLTDAATCGSSLASKTSCTLNVTFKPTQTGQFKGTLTIQTDNATFTADLYGEAVNSTWPSAWLPYVKMYSSQVQGLVQYAVVPSGTTSNMDLTGITYTWSTPGGVVLTGDNSTSSIIVAYDKAGAYNTSVTIVGVNGEKETIDFEPIQITQPDDFSIAFRSAIPSDKWSRAPSDVSVTVDAIKLPNGDSYAGTTFLLDGEEAAVVSGTNALIPVQTIGSHLITAIGKTKNGLEATAYTVVDLVQGDSPVCQILSTGDGINQLILEAKCSVNMGIVAVYEWYVNGSTIPIRGFKVDFAKSDLQQGIHYVTLKATTDKGDYSTWMWKNPAVN